MTNRASATANISWTSFNYPKSIAATDATGSETVAINYGPERQRVQQNYTGPGGNETTFYVGGLMDVVVAGTTTDNRHYIYAGNEPIAVYSRTAAGINTMSYMLEDHQGSISAITSNAGAVDVPESFSAFGARRNPVTWSGAPTTADLNTIASLSRQGYTFQTWLGQSMGLNHMNGRVEDAILGRFISPDPHITDPSNAQNYNRYSYVNNNPLSFTDPTGFDSCPQHGCAKPNNPNYAAAQFDADNGIQEFYSYGGRGSNNGWGPGANDGYLTSTDPSNGTSITIADANGADDAASLNAAAAVAAVAAVAAAARDSSAQSNSFNDPNAFNPHVAAAQYLQAQSGGATLTIPGLDFVPDPTIGMADFSAATSTLSMSAMSQQPNNFVTAAGALVGTSTVIGGGAGAIYAFGELATVTTTGIGVDFGGTIILSVGALSDVGGMAAVGSTVGAAGGVLLLPAFGVGWFIGSRLNPYVQPIISSWYGY